MTTYYVNPKMKTGYSGSYNLSFAQELGANFALDLAYVGTRGRRLSYEIGDINFDYTTQAEGLVSPNLGKIQALDDVGWSEYNSLQAKLTKRVSRNLNFLATYTWSHALDNGPAHSISA